MSLEFIYTNSDREDVGPLKNCSLDLEIGTCDNGSNDFEIKISSDEWDQNFTYESLFYCEGTEYGGIVKSITIDTNSKKITIGGITPRGILNNDYIEPRTRNDEYYTFDGEANEVIANYINGSRTVFNYLNNTETTIQVNNNLADYFTVSDEDSGFTVNYQARYMNTLQAFETMLANVGAKLHFEWTNTGMIEISVVAIEDYSNQYQFDNDYGIKIVAKKNTNNYNHCIGLGKNELKDRQIVHVFKINDEYLELNEITDISSIPANLVTMVYDYSSVESVDELIEGTKTKLQEAQEKNELSMEFENLDADICDLVGAKEYITGISLKTAITRKILKATFYEDSDENEYDIEYKVGE
ncbi:hypothetical protein [uncultured Thomasclavelia sp.]|uniref:hypothetical protein n=1 Tax=uncultured Thomasclavelia sp. TaxID=3025759 RepID=UPI002628496B|nr:hypothetical protein [uncultured Thomasclavelia sp.]